MSAKDELDRLERDWALYLQARERRPEMSFVTASMGSHSVRLLEVPHGIAQAVLTDLESRLREMVEEEYKFQRAELRARAVAEAEETIRELSGERRE